MCVCVCVCACAQNMDFGKSVRHVGLDEQNILLLMSMEKAHGLYIL